MISPAMMRRSTSAWTSGGVDGGSQFVGSFDPQTGRCCRFAETARQDHFF
jgi:hypothetical protein